MKNYRIHKKQKLEEEEQDLKISRHAKQQRKLEYSHQKRSDFRNLSSKNYSRVKDMSNSRMSNNSNQVAKTLKVSRLGQKPVKEIQFNNVKWLSIISAYDQKRMKHVTVSKKSCQNFLNRYGYDVKKDPLGNSQLKDLKKNFRAWLDKISDGYARILTLFLGSHERSALEALSKISPNIDQIKYDTTMMEDKIQSCLKIYDNTDFRKMCKKFESFFIYAEGLQEIITVIFDSKTRIDDLFEEMETNTQLDLKVEQIRRQGVHEAQNIFITHENKNDKLAGRIIGKVEQALRQMTTKSVDAYNRVQNVRQILLRLGRVLTEKHNFRDFRDIEAINAIFSQILKEAIKFQQFAEKYGNEGQLASGKLVHSIEKYREQINAKKGAVQAMQAVIVTNIVAQMIQTLEYNFMVSNIFEGEKLEMKDKFIQANHILQEVSTIMLDQQKKKHVEVLIRDSKVAYSRIEEEVDKIKRIHRRNEGTIYLDEQDGLVAILQYAKFFKQIKVKIKKLFKKQEEALSAIENTYEKKGSSHFSTEQDQQIIFLEKLSKICESENTHSRKELLRGDPFFTNFNEQVSIEDASQQARLARRIVKQLKNVSSKINHINDTNPLKKIIVRVRMENPLYAESQSFQELCLIAEKTEEKNIIQSLKKTEQSLNKFEGVFGDSSTYHFCVEKLYCLILSKGLKKAVIKELCNPKTIKYPENSEDVEEIERNIKYREIILKSIGQKTKIVSRYLSQNITILKQFLKTFEAIQKLELNMKDSFYFSISSIQDLMINSFKLCLIDQKEQSQPQLKKILLDQKKKLKTKLVNLQNLQKQAEVDSIEASLKIRSKVINCQTLNNKFIDFIDDLSKKEINLLESYSNLVLQLLTYSQGFNQKFYAAVNKYKQPIFIGGQKTAKDGILLSIGLQSFQRGKYIDSFIDHAPRVRQKNQIMMKEQLQEPQEQPLQDVYDEEFPEEGIEDIEMDQDIEMNQDIQDQMGQDIDEDEVNDQIIEGDSMGEQIVEQEKKVDLDKNKQIKQQKKQVIAKEKQTLAKNIIEQIDYFESLQQINFLIVSIEEIQKQFWVAKLDFNQIQLYFYKDNISDEEKDNFIKLLEAILQQFIIKNYRSQIIADIKKLKRVKSIKNDFTFLSQKSWRIFFKIIQEVEYNYSVLRNQLEEPLQIFIDHEVNSNFRKQLSKKCVQYYFKRQNICLYLKQEELNIDSFVQNCIKTQKKQTMKTDGSGFYYNILYTAKDERSLPEQDTQQDIEKVIKAIKKFENFEDGINLKQLQLNLWVKACFDVESNKTDFSRLIQLCQIIERMEDTAWVGHYLTARQKKANESHTQIRKHKSSLQNLQFRVNLSNILESISSIFELYRNQVTNCLYVNNDKKTHLIFFDCLSRKDLKINSKSSAQQFIDLLFSQMKQKKQKQEIQAVKFINLTQDFIEKRISQKEALKNSLFNILKLFKIKFNYVDEPQLFIIKKGREDIIGQLFKGSNIDQSNLDIAGVLSNLFQEVSEDGRMQLSEGVDFNIISKETMSNTQKKADKMYNGFKKHLEKIKTITSSLDNDLGSWCEFFGVPVQNQLEIQLNKFDKFVLQSMDECKKLLKKENIFLYTSNKKQQYQDHEKNLLQIKSKLDSTKTNDLQDGQYQKKIQKLLVDLDLTSSHQKYQIFSFKFENKLYTLKISLGSQQITQTAKKYLLKFCQKYILNEQTSDLSKVYERIYQRYISKNIQINETQKVDYCTFEIEEIVEEMNKVIEMKGIEEDQVVNFSKQFNILKFNPSAITPQEVQQTKDKIIQKMQVKMDLLMFYQVFHQNKRLGKISEKNDEIQLFFTELQIQYIESNFCIEKIDEYIKLTQQIEISNPSISKYGRWFTAFVANLLEDIKFFSLRSSEQELVTILPLKSDIRQDSKIQEQFKTILQTILIKTGFQIDQQQIDDKRYNIINLKSQKIHCKLLQKLQEQQQQELQQFLESFEEKSEMWILGYYQKIQQYSFLPLHIGEISFSQVECNLTITQENTTAEIACFISQISKKQYQTYKKKFNNKNIIKNQFKEILENMFKLVSKEQIKQNVKIGDSLSFEQTGKWIIDACAKEKKRKQTAKKIQEERQQQIELEREKQEQAEKQQSSKLLSKIYQQLELEDIPIYKMNLEDFEKMKGSQDEKKLQPHSQKLIQKTKSIKEKVEQKISSQEIQKFQSIYKHYVQGLTDRLAMATSIESQLFEQASIKYYKLQIQQEVALTAQQIENLVIWSQEWNDLDDNKKNNYKEYLVRLLSNQQSDKGEYLQILLAQFWLLNRQEKDYLALLK